MIGGNFNGKFLNVLLLCLMLLLLIYLVAMERRAILTLVKKLATVELYNTYLSDAYLSDV